MTAILEHDPPLISTVQRMTPPALDHVVKTCLEKDPDNRWHSAGDVRRQLTWIAGGSEESPVTSTQPLGWRRAVLMSVAASLLVGLIAGVAVWMLNEQPVKPLSRFVIQVPESEPLEITTSNTDVAISPNGSTIVYVATSARQLFVRPMDELEATPLRGTEGGYTPFFSPDSEWVGYRDWDDGTLSKVSVQGGPPLTIYELSPSDDLRGASWGPDDTIIFGTQSEETGLVQVSAAGGEPVVITTPDADKDEIDHVWPDILPGGREVLFTVLTGSDIENARIAVLSLESGEQKELIRGGSHPRYVPTGHIVYGVDNTLRAVAFDLERLEVRSNPVPVLESVISKSSGATDFSVAENGSLVYIAGSVLASTRRTMVWVDREGREEVLAAEPQFYQSISLSPDGRRVALVVRGEQRDVWIYDLARDTFTRLTFDHSNDSPIWTPDGRRVVFRSNREGRGIFWKAADGSGGVERLTEQPLPPRSARLSPRREAIAVPAKEPGNFLRHRYDLDSWRRHRGVDLENRISGGERGDLSRWKVDRVPVERVRREPDPCAAFSRRGRRQVVGFSGSRCRSRLGSGRPGALLRQPERHDGGARRDRAQLHARQPRAPFRHRTLRGR